MGSYTSSGIGSKGNSASYESGVNKKTSAYSPLKQVISLLEELDQSRQKVAIKEQELSQAKQELILATSKVQTKLSGLDPSTRELIKDILGQVDGKTSNSFTQEGPKERLK